MKSKLIVFILFSLLIFTVSATASATPYKTVTYAGAGIPSVDNSSFIVNLWLVDGNAPTDSQSVEVVLSNFSYVGDNRTDGGSPVGSFEWSGYTWTKRNQTLTAPGPNYWNSSNVWIDDDDKLHLKIQKVGSTWYCAELDSVDVFGYGTFTVTVESEFDFDPNIVLGLFTYTDDSNEIDVEVSHWGDIATNNTQYSNQPTMHGTYNVLLPNNYNETTHTINWMPGRINWYSMYGSPQSYTYTPTAAVRTSTFGKRTGSGLLDLNDSSPETMNITITNTSYTAGYPTSGNVGYWPLNGTANDYTSATKHNGTVTGSLAYSSNGAYFDGNDYVTHADMANPVWISWDMNTTQREQDIMSHWGWSNQYSWLLSELDNGAFVLVTSNTGSASTEYFTEPVVKNNMLQHYDMMFYNSRVYLYQDNICILNESSTALYNSNYVFAFGLAQYYANYVGYIKNIKYYSSFPSESTRLWNQVGANATYIQALPHGSWTAYTGSTQSVTDYGEMLAGIGFVANDVKLHTFTVSESYNTTEPLTAGIHEGYWQKWTGTGWDFVNSTPTNNSASLAGQLEVMVS